MIGFNVSLEQKLLAETLAKRLGYQNTSDLMRDLLENALAENYTREERDLIIRLTKPKVDIADESAPPGNDEATEQYVQEQRPLKRDIPIKEDSPFRRKPRTDQKERGEAEN